MLSISPAQLARERWSEDDPLARWFSEAGATEPWYGATSWRLWLPRKLASELLADLDRHAIPVRLAADLDTRGVYLYIWSLMPNPALQWLLRSYSAGASLIAPQDIP